MRGNTQKENLSNTANNNNNNSNNSSCSNTNESNNENYIDSDKRKFIREMCNGIQEKSSILQIHNKGPAISTDHFANLKSMYAMAKDTKKITNRRI